jgi:hypothetical protein
VTTNQNPAITGGTPITNIQGGAVGIHAEDKTTGLRADLEWVIGDHTLTVGIDNIKFEAFNEGQDQLVPRYTYSRLGSSASRDRPGHVGARRRRRPTATT